MKTIVTLMMCCCLWISLFAQVPQKMSYQAVIRDASGKLVTNHVVGIRITILQGALPGTNIYQETQTPTTNANGLVTIEIGGGTGFNVINWGIDVHFIKTETDPAGGTNYTISGTSQLLSVPYALYAEHAAGAATKVYVDALIGQLSKIGTIVADADGNIYPTVRIGSQVWMGENLKTTKYHDGTAIANVTDNAAWLGLTTGAYCWYNNDKATYGNTYGALYNWYTVNTGKLCPAGWHVPSDAEWTTLSTFLGGESVAGGKMKETGTTHWKSPNTGATNESGFSGLPSGYRVSNGNFGGIWDIGRWWSSTEYLTSEAWSRGLFYSHSSIGRFDYHKVHGFSVRCVRD